jgi:hypothetical protein
VSWTKWNQDHPQVRGPRCPKYHILMSFRLKWVRTWLMPLFFCTLYSAKITSTRCVFFSQFIPVQNLHLNMRWCFLSASPKRCIVFLVAVATQTIDSFPTRTWSCGSKLGGICTRASPCGGLSRHSAGSFLEPSLIESARIYLVGARPGTSWKSEVAI